MQSAPTKYPNRYEDTNIDTLKTKVSVLSSEGETFLIPRQEKNLNGDEYTVNKNACYQTYSKLQDCIYTYTENDLDDAQSSEELNNSNMNISVYNLELEKSKSMKGMSDKVLTHDNTIFVNAPIESTNADKKENQTFKELSTVKMCNKTIEHSLKAYDSSEEDGTSVELWEHNVPSTDSYAKEKSVNNNFKTTNDLYINNQVLITLNYNDLDNHNKQVCTEVVENEILFEDFLEICTEVCIPRGWSCLVTSKGHGTTVVYLCMGITKNGIPFVEKQIFIKSDMILHCAVANKEIDPLLHNLVKEGKRIKLRNLLDIEELIDEFDQRIICQGIYSSIDNEHIGIIKAAYNDGTKWRHISCPLIINNDSCVCTKCTTLFHTLIRKSRKLLSLDNKLR